MPTPSSSELKQRERATWALAASGWKRRDALLRKGAAPVSTRLLELAAIAPGQRVLDIASGLGEPAIPAAQLVGPGGQVTGTDLVEDMLIHAREKATAAGIGNIEFLCVDGETLEFEAAYFDAATCRWGLMFMPEPAVCLRLVHGVMQDNARFATACWSAPEKNPFINLLIQVLGNYMELPKPFPDAPGIFSLADPDRLLGLLESAGFRDVELEEMEINALEVADGNAYWEAMSDLAAPVMTLVRQLDDASRESFIADVISNADALKQEDTLRMRGTTWLASGVR
ncbi:MAG: class I SAM-dependent methyltransferase [Gammaproteobacteria bacterium]